MQFQDYLANECERPDKYNCAGCHDNRLKCLKHGPFEIKTLMRVDGTGERITRKITSRDDMNAYIDEVLQYNIKFKNPPPAQFEYFVSGEICPIPFIDDETVEVVNMIDLTGRIDPDKYWDLPAVFIEVKKIVDGERRRLANLRIPKSGKK